MSVQSFNLFVYVWAILGLLLIPVLLKIRAPYGRFSTSNWGLMINNRLGWILMESPALLVFVIFFLAGNNINNLTCIFIFSLWVLHYSQRVFIFPFRIRTKGKKMPVLVMCMAILYNLVNGFINGWFLGSVSGFYKVSDLQSWNFIAGTILFLSGMFINLQSDNILRNLRSEGETGYKIPYGGLFRYISSPNYFGEILEWTGFVLVAWNLPALAFLIWTVANLLPRAITYHQWYRQIFSNYPRKRKALIPYIL